MTEHDSLPAPEDSPPPSNKEPMLFPPVWRVLISVVLITIFVVGGLLIAGYMLKNRPKAQRQRPPRQARLVTVQPVQLSDQQVTVQAMGTVMPATSIELSARVAGEVTDINPTFIPGGRFSKGEHMLTIDPEDYRLAVADQEAALRRFEAESAQRRSDIEQRELDIKLAETEIERRRGELRQRDADVVQMASSLQLEQGQQSLAQQEFELLGLEIADQDRQLVLRQPQQAAAQARHDAAVAARDVAASQLEAAQTSKESAIARLEAAKAALEAAEAGKSAAEVALSKARLNLQRTTILAPFDGVVQERYAWVGTQVSSGRALATLVATDVYWVKASVPVDQLRWLSVPGYSTTGAGSPAVLRDESAWPAGQQRTGTVSGLLTDLEPSGRLAQVLISVDDPLTVQPGTPSLILGSYMSVTILGARIPDTIKLSRGVVRDDNTVWEMTPEKTLAIRQVDVGWSDRDSIYVTGGLSPGAMIVSSDLSTPLEGMELRVEDTTGTKDAATPRPAAENPPAEVEAHRDAPLPNRHGG